MKKRYVYSVRRARKNLLEALRAEVRANQVWRSDVSHGTIIARRERAVRDLIASVRAEERAK